MTEENLGGLFDMDPVVINVGDAVTAHTIWGDLAGTLVGVQTLEDGYKLATVATEKRGEVMTSLSRLSLR